MKIYFFLLSLLSFYYSIGQVSLSGRVIQKGTAEPVPYATIGLAKKNTGTNADEKGVFAMETKGNLNDDTIIVSSVGYESLRVPFVSLSQPFVFELEKKFHPLPEVVIKDKWKTKTLNDTRGCGDYARISVGFETQVAQTFEAPIRNAYLTSVSLCTGGREQTFLFRLRVYDIDSATGGPGEDLCNEVIEIISKKNKETVDLSKYNIRIPGRHFFVAVEWIIIPSNRWHWTEEHKTHGPRLGIIRRKTNEGVWSRYYNDKWTKFHEPAKTTISATITY